METKKAIVLAREKLILLVATSYALGFISPPFRKGKGNDKNGTKTRRERKYRWHQTMK